MRIEERREEDMVWGGVGGWREGEKTYEKNKSAANGEEVECGVK